MVVNYIVRQLLQLLLQNLVVPFFPNILEDHIRGNIGDPPIPQRNNTILQQWQIIAGKGHLSGSTELR